MRVRNPSIPLIALFLACGRAGAAVHPVAAKAVSPHPHAREVVVARGTKMSAREKVKTPPRKTTAVEAEPAQDAVHVRHDRKIHHSTEEAPRKATAADFMADTVTKTDSDVPAVVDNKATAGVLRSAQDDGVKQTTATAKGTAAVRSIRVAPGQDDGVKEAAPSLYTKGGRLIVPPAMKGSHEILVRQNEMADREGLSRVQDDVDLDNLRESRQLVAIPKVQGMETDERLPANRRYCRPWTAQFLTALAKAHYQRFHRALQVNSAVRTVEVQERLLRTNGNAAPVEGETASPHLTGQAVDLAKKGLSMTEIAWLRGYLLPLVQQGKVDVEEEFQQSCFHVSVYKKYLPQDVPKREIAQGRRQGVTALAAAVR